MKKSKNNTVLFHQTTSRGHGRRKPTDSRGIFVNFATEGSPVYPRTHEDVCNKVKVK